ncbi:hypothetical protein DPMN_012544 [Dreissena polymorpha]|uniref:Uncharacterized protein n=1 Tax=Dreissena polymorpha TaxID=45954 RepID=A0A9D4S2X3_DREPO|nr:hypothetical protein DPMN_012544 [Dreissena polymorpha]
MKGLFVLVRRGSPSVPRNKTGAGGGIGKEVSNMQGDKRAAQQVPSEKIQR